VTARAPRRLVDDVGLAVDLPDEVARVVSLVPSLTEAVAVSAPGLLVGATDWCSHPPDLAVARVRGTKNPRIEQVIDLRPEVVLANEEDNQAIDLAALRTAGVAVWTTAPRTVPEALSGLRRMLVDACGLPPPGWLADAEAAWSRLGSPQRRHRVVVPIWRRPWMALGRATFAGDVLARLGYDNVLADDPDRYPRIQLPALPPVDLIVLPDEPYRFTAEDGPEAFPDVPAALVSGRHLTWYGPSLAEAPGRLAAELAVTRTDQE
jgi:ABC-type Fe3+-hydroxamate transport system substrate-binding protein